MSVFIAAFVNQFGQSKDIKDVVHATRAVIKTNLDIMWPQNCHKSPEHLFIAQYVTNKT